MSCMLNYLGIIIARKSCTRDWTILLRNLKKMHCSVQWRMASTRMQLGSVALHYCLLSLNVAGMLNVPSVIRIVLSMVNKNIDRLPSVGLLSQMLVELKQVSAGHVAEKILEAKDVTLHSDGTSKFGKLYQSYQISTPEQSYTLGICDMKCGTAAHGLEKLKEVLNDVESACCKTKDTNVANQIVAKIKNTMSDRCSVQKSFNDLLTDYRAEILPSVVEGWTQLQDDERSAMIKMNNFFCGLHYIVGLADQASKSLREWEDIRFGSEKIGANEVHGVYDTKESRVVRLIRTATSAFEKHGNEQAGVVGDFHAFLSQSNTQLPLSEFRGNRNYIVFYNGAGIFFLHECMIHSSRGHSWRDKPVTEGS
eukprot:scpid72751/ scgid14724/ 